MNEEPSCSSRRSFLASTVAAAVAATLAIRPARLRSALPGTGGAIFRPEDFGARGDGRTDDTLAFQALGNAASGGRGVTIALAAGAVYRLGRQAPTEGRSPFSEQPMLLVRNVDGLVIEGNGATLKLNDGLRYGSFDPATGEAFSPPDNGKFADRRYAAVVGRLLQVADSRNVHIANLSLDGNVDRLIVGGRWGDKEIQLAAMGLQLTAVSEVTVEDVTSRNNGLDGVYLYGRNRAAAGGAPDNIVFRRVRCDRNGRQGMSVTGGKTLRFEQCSFTNTAQGPVSSRPTAGVDIEPNGADWATDLSFVDCLFANNLGVGLLASAGSSGGLTAQGCTFWQGFRTQPGKTRGSGDAFWITRDGTVIEGCQVHGSVTHLAATAEVRRSSFDDAVHPSFGRAAQRRGYLLYKVGGSFEDCTFTVDGDTPMALVNCQQPILFRRCKLHFAGTGLPADRAIAGFSPNTTLEDVTFTEGRTPGRDRRFIYGGNARLLGRVVVTGPGVRWNSRTGPIGNIAALQP